MRANCQPMRANYQPMRANYQPMHANCQPMGERIECAEPDQCRGEWTAAGAPRRIVQVLHVDVNRALRT